MALPGLGLVGFVFVEEVQVIVPAGAWDSVIASTQRGLSLAGRLTRVLTGWAVVAAVGNGPSGTSRSTSSAAFRGGVACASCKMTFMAIAIDIHAGIQDLKGAGIKPGWAEVIVKAVSQSSDNLATKSDLASTNRSRTWPVTRRDAGLSPPRP